MSLSKPPLKTEQSWRSPSVRHRRTPLVWLLALGLLPGVLGVILGSRGLSSDGLATLWLHLTTLLVALPKGWELPRVPTLYLLIPSWGLLWGSWLVTRSLCPQPRPWSRRLVVATLLVLLGRYLVWRIFSTLNWTDGWLSASVSVGLLLMELLGLSATTLQLVLLWRVRDRRSQANQMAKAVLTGEYAPSVDILIPTYNEPAFILRRTVIGCQALDYPNKRVYLLDDTRRPEIQELAAELGCEYRTRPNNLHAKAGNLNHALLESDGELIACFDADFVPTCNFLQRTVGFFQDTAIALVQTPQSFYNADPIARNLGLETILTPEEEVFYRQIQPMRDAAGSVVCAGTSFVVRRTALEASGGFVTESLSEDYFTGIKLAALGHRVVYLDEKLSAGLAAETLAAQINQRLRWARGTLQAFFIRTNPLTMPGLGLFQRLGHLEGILHWFTALARLYFLFVPLAYTFFQVVPLRTTGPELLYFFVPYYLVQLSVFAWLNGRSRSALLSDIYALVMVFPLAVTVIQALIRPFGRGFQVTPKGTLSDRAHFNGRLAGPLLLLWGLTALSFWHSLQLALGGGVPGTAVELDSSLGIELGWVWSGYNLAMLTVALGVFLDAPRLDRHPWFGLPQVAKVRLGDLSGLVSTWWGTTTELSESGARMQLTRGNLPGLNPADPPPVELTLVELDLTLQGNIVAVGPATAAAPPQLEIRFLPLSLAQERRLIALLYCRPGQWPRRNSPGEARSLLLLLRVLLRPRWLRRDRASQALQLTSM